ncbi:MAG: hydroxymethylglutaryl-CoA lyase [Bacteroidota bacterium]|nr:hydroxymethylglutaryl-CoA lyase [Bacteroidota bacterium]
MQQTLKSIGQNIRLTECPRDAMQGMHTFVPTEKKIEYMNSLLKVGYDILDFGSFVSPKAIPQLRDTAEVLEHLDLNGTDTKLLAIVGNMRGANDAVQYEKVSYLGFPFSISDTFLRLNINSNLGKAFSRAVNMLELCEKKDKKLMIYLSMGFGNPYNDPWSIELVVEWVRKLRNYGAHDINLSDTVGVSTIESIGILFNILLNEFPDMNFGLHLHTKHGNWYDKIDAAFSHGCRCFDGVLTGYGGCPLSGAELVGNLQMRNLIHYFDDMGVPVKINRKALEKAYSIALSVFPEIL